MPIPAKKLTNIKQNLDKLKNVTLLDQKSANFSQKIEELQTILVL